MNFARLIFHNKNIVAFSVGCLTKATARKTISCRTNSYSTKKTSVIYKKILHIRQLSSLSYAVPKSKKIQSDASRPKKQEELESNVISTPSGQTKKGNVIMDPATQILRRRTLRKKTTGFEELSAQGFYNVTAFATAEEYNLEALVVGLEKQNLYAAKKFFSTDNLGLEQDVLYVTAKYEVGAEARDIFFFREGSVVLWNFKDLEANNVLLFIKAFEKDPYLRPLVRGESEIMPYTYVPQNAVDVEGDLIAESEKEQMRAFFYNGKFYLTSGEDNFLQKYTFSNAMATSIKLGIWEATLDRYIDSMEYLTEDLKRGRRLRISRAAVLRKTGELFALRHAINLSSDLLDTPDFYWDREELEALYLQICNYFSISRRTKVMNEKINHCVELAELVSSNLNDAHHIRLEWMIIILIMVEVGFEIVHYMDRYYTTDNSYHLNEVE